MLSHYMFATSLAILALAGCGQPHGRPLYTRVVTDITVANASVQSLDVSPDGKYLAIGGQDSIVRIWPLPDLQYTGSLSGHRRHVWCVRFSPDGRLLASSSGLFDESPVIRMWKVPSGDWVRTLPGYGRNIVSLAFDPAGNWLASAACSTGPSWQEGELVRLWSVSDGSVLVCLAVTRVR
jgi:WD40 repeat protein